MLLLATVNESRQVKPNMMTRYHPLKQTVFFSDRHRAPDWRAALTKGGPHCGLILRDYEADNRAALAAEMRAFCRNQKRFFAIAGERKLASRMGAAFHCPSHLLRRPLCYGPLSPLDTAAVHNETELFAALRAGFRTVFISPVFTTNSHIGQRGLGPIRARALAEMAASHGAAAFALGGMNADSLRRLNGDAPVFYGYGAIDAFCQS